MTEQLIIDLAVTLYEMGDDDPKWVVDSPDKLIEIADYFLPYDRTQKTALVVLMNVRHEVTHVLLHSIGDVSHTFLGPRDVLVKALRHNAVAIATITNNPSGSAEAGEAEVQVGRRLSRACELIGIGYLDHLVTNRTGTAVSLARQGRL
jgi:DNA repair protein RadC